MSPSGMMTRQLEELKSKSIRMAETVLMQALSRKEALIMYHGFYLPSITYPFAVTCLAENQCHAIETPFLKAILPKCGYSRSMSRAIRYAPIRYGGAGFHWLYGEQVTQSILTAIKHLRCPRSQPGRLAAIAMSWAQAYAGVSWGLWTQPEKPIPTIPNPWITSIQQALKKLNAKIIGLDSLIPNKQRLDDDYIMDIALNSQIFSRTELDTVNAFRRFYQATTIADISDDRGLKIREEVWHGTGDPSPDDFSTEFFNQAPGQTG